VIDFCTKGDTRRLLFESVFLHITQLYQMSPNFSLHELKENGSRFVHMDWTNVVKPVLQTVLFSLFFSACLSRFLLMLVYSESGNLGQKRNATSGLKMNVAEESSCNFLI